MQRTEIATFFREAFHIEAMTPEEFAARFSHKLGCFSVPYAVHLDPELEAWTQRLTEIIYEAGLVEKLRKLYLSDEEIQAIKEDDGF